MRRQQIAPLIGAVGGGLAGAILGWVLVDLDAACAAMLAGAVAGCAGGTCGRDFAQGTVVAGLCLGLLAVAAVLPVVWLPAMAVGLCVGNGIGWVSRGRLA
jgi:hypothetical protein